MQKFLTFLRDESGTSSIEYGFILTLITIGIIGSIVSMGNSVTTYLNNVLSGLMMR